MRFVQVCGVAVACAVSVAHGEVLLVPDHYSTIQAAINVSVSGDIVQVQPGIYNELIDFSGKAITVTGAGSSKTTIDGTGLTGPVVRFASEEGAGSVLEGFRIGHGTGEIVSDPVFGNVLCGGGVFVRSASPTIRNCLLENNVTWGGGGMCINSGTPTISDCVFRNNVVEGHGGGLYNINIARPVIERCLFEGNTASWGSGMTCTVYSDATIIECDFVANTTYNVGGGIFIRSSSSPTITACTFTNNLQTDNPLGSGGGICVYGSGTGGGPCYPVVTDCLFEGNTVNGDGGGMSNAYGSYTTITNCIFRENTCGRDGGGVAAVGENDPDVPSNVTVSDCLFEFNTAADRGGGFFSRRSEPSVMNCTIRENTASDGGGIYFFDSAAATMGDTQNCGNSAPQVGGDHVDLGGNTVSEECEDCAADIDGDGTVGVNDMLNLIANFGPCSGCAADVDGDGIVGVNDILIVLSAWGPCH